jgi:hypothetical protein
MYSVVCRHDVDGHSFAPIGLYKTDAASDWLVIKWDCYKVAIKSILAEA